jgi:hypothetical protein
MKRIFLLLALLNIPLIAQNHNDKIAKKNFSFGRFWNWPESIVYVNSLKMLRQGIVYRDTEFYLQRMNYTYPKQGIIIDSLVTNKNIKIVNFKRGSCDIGSILMDFKDFNGQLIIDSLDLKSVWGPSKSIIKCVTKVRTSYLQQGFWFGFLNFKNRFEINGCRIDTSINILSCQYDSSFILANSTVKGNVIFEQSKFNSLFSLFNSTFNNKPEFRLINFGKAVSLSGCDFKEGIDLRRCNFDSTESIYLENLKYPIGKFYVNWEQIKAQKYFKIVLDDFTVNNYDFTKLALIYEKLRDNYLAQGNKQGADSVMYELAQYKQNLIGGFWHCLYGFFLGYGYEPLRFFAFWLLPWIFIFTFIWYSWYYRIIKILVSPAFDSDFGLSNNESIEIPTKVKFGKIKIYDHKKITPHIIWIVRVWHVIYFSASVLLSIKFKNRWIIDHKDKEILKTQSFMVWVTIEWVLGIVSYFLFAMLVLNNQFSYLKGLFNL